MRACLCRVRDVRMSWTEAVMLVPRVRGHATSRTIRMRPMTIAYPVSGLGRNKVMSLRFTSHVT